MVKNVKQLFLNLPEWYELVLTVVASYLPPFSFNPILLALSVILILQLLFKNKVVGLATGVIFLLLNLYMLGALISELREFSEFNIQAQKLLFVGLSLWIINMIASLFMIFKYSKTDHRLHLVPDRNIIS